MKKILPESWIDRLKPLKKTKLYIDTSYYVGNLKSNIEIFLIRIFSRNKFTSLIYYVFFSRAFLREQHAVLKGMLHYYDSLQKPEKSKFLLRRNTHRLEKGLLMRPRREIFALGYIRETVDAYHTSLNHSEVPNSKNGKDDGEIEWAHDVLAEYFKVAGSHPHIDEQRGRFIDINTHPKNEAATKYIPYKRFLDTRSEFSYEAFLKLAKFRRSVRWFQQKEVPRDLIDKAINIASLSPTACNRQPYEYRILDDYEDVRSLANLPTGTPGYRDNIPVMVAVVGKLDAYFDERDRHLIYIDSGLSIMSFIYGLEILGLSSCCINWPDIEQKEKKMEKLLGLEPHERVVMCIAVGYPDPEGEVAYSKKKNIENIRTYFSDNEH